VTVSDLSATSLAIKVQSVFGTPVSGAGAFGIEVLPSTGLALAIQSIESNMIKRSRMRNRPRHGSRFATASYETELVPEALDDVYEAVLGGTIVAAQPFTDADWGAVVISGTGTLATFASGTIITDGIVAGQVAIFTNLSVAGNNSVPVPILSVTEGTLVFPSGYLVDNTSDAAWNVSIARHVKTTTPYVDRLFTVEEVQGSIDRSKLGTDMRFNSLNFDSQANQMTKVGFGLGGRNMSALLAAASPNFTSPVYASGDSLILLDGGMFTNGTKRINVTGCTFGLAAPVTGIPVVGTNTSPGVFIGQYALTGNFNVVMEDLLDFDAFDAETNISMFLHFRDQLDASKFVTVYMGHMSYAGYSSPIGGEGGAIAQIPLYGGEDNRGAAFGYAQTAMLISMSGL
jgi:hypothetical protein